jgi:hypothetical protein
VQGDADSVGEGRAAAWACPELAEGLSSVVTSQQPAALDMEVLSQVATVNKIARTGQAALRPGSGQAVCG